MDIEDSLKEELMNIDTRERAFRTLVSQYQERLYWHIRKIVISHEDSDDVLQNCFVKVWRGLDNFRGDASLFTWIYRIATNEALTHLQKKSKSSTLPMNETSEYLMENLESSKYFHGDEIEKRLQEAILTLPDKQKLVFNMKYFEDMKYSQIAEVLDLSVGGLKASYHHAVKKIEHYLKGFD